MAATLSDIAAALTVLNAEGLADQVIRTSLMFQVLRKKEHTEGQEVLSTPIEMAGMANARKSTGAAVNRTTDFNTVNKRARTSQAWSRAEGYARIDGLARDLSKANARASANGGGLAGMTSLVVKEGSAAVNDLTALLTPWVYTGDPTDNEFCGIDAICTTGTFAGVNPATSGQSSWAAVDATGALVDLNWRQLRDELIDPFRTNCNKDPEFITCSKAMFNALADSIDDMPGHRASAQVQPGGQSIESLLTRVVGTNQINIAGVIVVPDAACPANSFYAWHRAGGVIEYVPSEPEITDGLMEAMGAITGRSGLEVATAQALIADSRNFLVPSIQALGREGDFEDIMAILRLQFRVSHRNHFGRLILS